MAGVECEGFAHATVSPFVQIVLSEDAFGEGDLAQPVTGGITAFYRLQEKGELLWCGIELDSDGDLHRLVEKRYTNAHQRLA